MVRECFRTGTGIRFQTERLKEIGLDPVQLWPYAAPSVAFEPELPPLHLLPVAHEPHVLHGSQTPPEHASEYVDDLEWGALSALCADEHVHMLDPLEQGPATPQLGVPRPESSKRIDNLSKDVRRPLDGRMLLHARTNCRICTYTVCVRYKANEQKPGPTGGTRRIARPRYEAPVWWHHRSSNDRSLTAQRVIVHPTTDLSLHITYESQLIK